MHGGQGAQSALTLAEFPHMEAKSSGLGAQSLTAFPLMQWQRVRGGHGFGTPGYGDGFAADLHRLPFSSALVQG